MKVKAVSVRCFELFTAEVSHAERPETVIVDYRPSLFDAVFGDAREDVEVIKASPDFILRAQPT